MLAAVAVHVIGEAALLADLQEEPRAHALAEHRVDEVERVPVRVHVGEGAAAQADVGLLGLLLQQHHLRRAVAIRRRVVGAFGGAAGQAEAAVDHVRGAVRIDASRHAHHQPAAPVVLTQVVDQVVTRHRRDRFRGAHDVAAKRMPRPHGLLEDAVHVVLGLVLVHLAFLQDHHPLALDVVGSQLGVGDDVAEHVDRQLQPVHGHARPVDGHLLVGGGVHDAPHALDRLGDVFGRRPAAGAFEEQVLDEVGNAADGVRLEPGADAEHQHHAGGHPVRHGCGQDPGASRQLVEEVTGGRGHARPV